MLFLLWLYYYLLTEVASVTTYTKAWTARGGRQQTAENLETHEVSELGLGLRLGLGLGLQPHACSPLPPACSRVQRMQQPCATEAATYPTRGR